MHLDEKIFKRITERCSVLAKNMLAKAEGFGELFRKLDKEMKKFPKISKTASDIKLFADMVRAYVTKEYTEIPFTSIVSILATLLYLVNPFDIVPDVIPVIGQIDDIAVVSLCLKLCGKDIEKFRVWRDEKIALEKQREEKEKESFFSSADSNCDVDTEIGI